MMYVDVHAHIGDSSFDADRDEVLARAREVIILEAGLDHQSNIKALELAEKYSNIRPCLGFHPEFIVNASEADIDREIVFIRENASKIVAVSEIGLDNKFGFKEKQLSSFSKFLRLAEELNIPVVVHSRWAAGAILNALKGFSCPVDLHAFSGNLTEVQKAIDAGHFLSIGPNVVFNEYRQKLASTVPLEQMLTETDSPVLGPRFGERNEPANISLATEKIAEVKGLAAEDVRETTYRSAKQIFKL